MPIDLNADNIMQQLNRVYLMLKSPDEENETWFESVVRLLIYQLEIYDQVWVARDVAHTVRNSDSDRLHSRQAIDLAERMLEFLSEDEGAAECYPFEIIEELRGVFLEWNR